MKKSQDLKIALVHDFLTQFGGAERVLEVLCEMFPDAPIYTLLYDKEKMRGKFADKIIHTTFLQNWPKFMRKRYKFLLPFLPVAPETIDLREYDLVITSSGAWMKGIVTRLKTTHICYLHSPMRFVWDENEKYLKQQNRCRIIRFLARGLLSYIRLWDKLAVDRPDYLIANSKFTQGRVRKYYRRESMVIYPPVQIKSEIRNPKLETMSVQVSDLNRNSSERLNNTVLKNFNDPKSCAVPCLPAGRKSGDIEPISDIESKSIKKYFLVVSRLSAYKQIDKVVEAFNKLELPLVVIGEGEEKKHLENIAAKNVKILGWQTDEKIETYYQNARAFLFAGVDDFGIAPAEAMTRGVPVLAIRKGGVREIVEEGKAGEFFDAATPEVIADCVRRFLENELNYDREYIRQSAEKFGKERFKRELEEYIETVFKFT